MNIKRLHYFSGLTITVFVGLHLFNHAWSIFGAEAHIALMDTLRLFYRNPIVETLLLIAVAVQIFSGSKLVLDKRKTMGTFFEKLQVWSGIYLAFFLIIHVTAVMAGRFLLSLDTNFYFGVAGLNNFPFNVFFIPYYALAILAFFGHAAAIHNTKMHQNILGLTPKMQAHAMLLAGVVFTLLVFAGLTDRFRGVEILVEYNVLIGK